MTVAQNKSGGAIAPPRERASTQTVPDLERSTVWWLVAMALVGSIARLAQVRADLYGTHTFRETQTLFPALWFHEHGVTMFHTDLPVFGSQRNVPFELPVYQAVASLLTFGGGLDVLTAAKFLSLVAFQVAALLWTRQLARWSGGLAAVVFMGLFQVLPFAVEWGVVPLIDFFSVALGMACVALFDQHLRTGRWWSFGGAVAFCWLTLLVKVTTFPSTGVLLLAAVVLARHLVARQALLTRVITFGLAGPGVGLGLLLMWTRWADGVKAAHPSTTFLTSGELWGWNFAYRGQRTDPWSYRVLIERVGGEIGGVLLIAVVMSVAAVLFVRRYRLLMLLLLLAASAPVLIHFNLYVVHEYYLIAIYPVLVAILAIGISAVAGSRPSAGLRVGVGFLLSGLALASTLADADGREAETMWVPQPYENVWASALMLQTQPDDRIALVGCDWDPTILWMSGRTGLMITGHESQPVSWQRISEDYSYLVACGGEPYAVVPRDLKLAKTSGQDLYAIAGWRGSR